MGTTQSPDILWQAAGWALGLIGVVALLRGLFWNRVLRRRRARSMRRNQCIACAYDLTGSRTSAPNASPVCPECGTTQLHLTRLRVRWAAIALGAALLLAASQVYAQPRRDNERWTRWLPTTALIMLADLEGSSDQNDLCHALWLRGDSLWRWQGAIVLWRERTPDPETLRALVVTRAKWVAGSPAELRLAPPETLRPLVGSRSFRAQVRMGDESKEVFQWMHAPFTRWVCGGVGLDPSRTTFSRDAGRHRITINGVVEAEAGDFMNVQARWTQSIEVEVVPQLSEAVQARRSPELDATMQAAFVAGTGSGRTVMVWWSPDSRAPRPCGFRFEMLRDGSVVDSAEGDGSFLQWDPQSTVAQWAAPGSLPPELIKRLSVRVTGDAAATLTGTNSDWYWSGAVEIPVQELLDRRAAQQAKGQ